jgi:hypothetical protein
MEGGGGQERPVQVICCGFARSGSTLLYNMLRHTVRGVLMPETETTAANFLDTSEPVLTSRPLDLFRVSTLTKANAGRKDLRFVLIVRDPRALVTSRHPDTPMQWFQGYDHQFHATPDGLSFSTPGVLYTHELALNVSRRDLPILVCRYEDLVQNPEDMQAKLAQFTGFHMEGRFSDFHQGEIPPSLQRPMNGVRPLDPSGLQRWEADPVAASRVARQFRLEPRMFDVLAAWGYETDETWFDRLARRSPEGLDDRPGLIVSYYTAGSIYEHEALRMTRSAHRLGLPVDLHAVSDQGGWLANVRMKARFLLERRRRLRGPLLWVDADAFFHADPWPYLRGYDGDVAVSTDHSTRVASGTILLNDTPGAVKVLEAWAARSDATPESWDQHSLEDVVKAHREAGAAAPYRIQYLPPSMCYVFDRTPKSVPTAARIIEHLQASREQRLGEGNDERNLASRRARVAELDGGETS